MPKAANNKSKTKQQDSVQCTVDIRQTSTQNQQFFDSLAPNYIHCEDTISMLTAILPTKFRNKSCTIDNETTLVKWTSISTKNGKGILRISKNNIEQEVQAYEKKIPLIEPFHWMKYNERPTMPFFWSTQKPSILDAENQAYIDVLGSSLVSKLTKLYNSPHFCKFYGCFRTVLTNFRFNLHEDLEDLRFTQWFWEKVDKEEFTIHVYEKNSGRKLTLEELKSLLKPDDEYLENSDDDTDNSDSDSDRSTSTSGSGSTESTQLTQKEEHLETITTHQSQTFIELEEADFDNKSTDSTPIFLNRKSTRNSTQSSNFSNVSFTDDYEIYVDLPNMPAVIMYAETCHGTMDELLSQTSYSPVSSSEKEAIWSAWIFQVCMALCQLQGGLRLTHNDLHTNNVMWKETTEEYLYYMDNSNRVWKVPTYGRIFTIIDYGRAIFTINSFFCISSDYQDGRNAHGQYNFGPLEDPDEPKVYPNKSFDLCRLSCSLLRGLFPYNPAEKENGKVITKERGWIVKETNHSLFNLLWSWLRDDDGANILELQDGNEKYPGFDLYIEIAHSVHSAVPQQQLAHPAFKSFLLSTPLPKNIQYIKVPI